MRVAHCLAASLIAVTAGSAHARIQAVSDAPSAAEGGSGLEEVVVTAQRREENLQRTAVAVAAIGGDAIQKAGVAQVGRLQELVPALMVEPTSSGNLIFIRGVGNFNLTNNSDPATAFNYDEVYIGRPSSTEGVFYDLERVEVLKGPQGTLYGRNATAGAINVLPAKPKIGEWTGYASFGYGNYEAVSAEGAVNAPIGQWAALRVAGTTVTHDGYLKDGSSDEDTQAVRMQLLAEPTSDLSVRASFDHARQGGKGAGLSYVDEFSFDPSTGTYGRVPSGVAFDGMFTPAAQQFRTTLPFASLGRNAEPLLHPQTRDNEYSGAHLNVAWSTTIGDFTLIPAWRSSRYHVIIVPAFTSFINADTQQRSVEARFASERFSIFDLTAGLLYFDEQIDQHMSYNLQASQGFDQARYDTDSKAAYLRMTANITGALRITGGVRYSRDTKSVAEANTSLIEVCVVPTGCPTVPLLPWTEFLSDQPIVPAAGGIVPLGASGAILARIDGEQHASVRTNRATWRGAVEYDLSGDSFAYASIETGYRSGGFNFAGSPPYTPEFITAYTLGIKNELFDNRLRLNVESFLWKYRDQQLSYVGFDSSGSPANLTDNIGRVTMKGAEVELSMLAARGTLLSADVQYLDAKYDSFVYRTPAITGVPYTTCPVTSEPTEFVVNCNDFRAFNAPEWTVNLGAQQTVDIGNYQLIFNADTQYRSSRYIFFQYVPEQAASSNWQTNAQITFAPADDRWSLSAFVRNIENERTPVFAPTPPFLSSVTVQHGAPRTYGARLAVKF